MEGLGGRGVWEEWVGVGGVGREGGLGGGEGLGKDCSLCKVVGLWLRVTVGRFGVV